MTRYTDHGPEHVDYPADRRASRRYPSKPHKLARRLEVRFKAARLAALLGM